MKTKAISVLGLMVLMVAYVISESESRGAEFPFRGTWTGQMNGLPGIDLTIEQTWGKISGFVVFYRQKRASINEPWKVTGEYRTTLLRPRVAGKVLTFETQHHTCDGCEALGPNAKFRFDLTGVDEARFWNLSENPHGAGLTLLRRR